MKVFYAIIAFLVLLSLAIGIIGLGRVNEVVLKEGSYADSATVALIEKRVGNNAGNFKILEQNVSKLDTLIKTVNSNLSNRVIAVEKGVDAVNNLAQKNERYIVKLDSAVSKIEANYKELRNVVTAHGYKANDIAELIFQVAYQDDSTGKVLYDKYQRCGNQEYWDTMLVKLDWEKTLKKLTPVQIEKILKIDEINKRIGKLEAIKADRKSSETKFSGIETRLQKVEKKISKIKTVKRPKQKPEPEKK